MLIVLVLIMFLVGWICFLYGRISYWKSLWYKTNSKNREINTALDYVRYAYRQGRIGIIYNDKDRNLYVRTPFNTELKL